MVRNAVGGILLWLLACGNAEGPETPATATPERGTAERETSVEEAVLLPSSTPSPATNPAGATSPARGDDWLDVDAESLRPHLQSRPEPYLLVNVWSTWCEPCVREMPEVIQTAQSYRGRGLGLVLIAADAPAQRDDAMTFLRAQNAPLPSWFKRGSDDAFITALHPEWTGALPATFLLDRNRLVRHFWADPVTAESLRSPIDALLERDNP